MPGKSTPNPLLFQSACAFAARKHTGQLRKDHQTPYFSHCARVAMTVSTIFECSDPIALAAAFLHDTIEDTTTDFDDLEKHFGIEVATIVAALTKNMALPEAKREADYDNHLATAPWQARLIKLADQYDNYCDLVNKPKSDAKSQTAQLKKSREKCNRALSIAAKDTNPAIVRARQSLKNLIA